MMKQFSYAEMEAATDGFAAKNLIGKGSHGSVYRAKLKQQGGGGGRRRIGMSAAVIVVAVKRPSHAQGEAKLANEIAVLSAAPRHPGLIGIVGASSPPPPEPASASGPALPSLLVMEFMPNGSLHDLLHGRRSPPPPPWPRRLEIALDVARAVQALHAAHIIHRDVKSANVLLGPDGRARLSDFSLAVTINDDDDGDDGEEEEGPAPAGTMGYLDPCYTEPGRLGPASDVYSFGVVVLELVSGRKVMDVSACPSSLVSWAAPLVAAGRGREVLDARVGPPPGPPGSRAVERVLAVAARCVAETVERRPGMDEVVAELSAAVESAGWGGGGGGVVERVCRRVAEWGKRVRRRSKRVVVVMRAAKVECTEHSSDNSGGGGGGVEVAVAPDPGGTSSCAAAAAALASSQRSNAARSDESSKAKGNAARVRFESELDLVFNS